MRKLVIGGAVAAAIWFAGCGATAQEACVKGFGPQAKAVATGDEDEAYCMVPGRNTPAGEVEDGGTGYEVDD